MANKKKITFNMIDADMGKQEPTVIYFGTDNKFELHVKKTLSIAEAAQFVQTVVNVCADEDSGTYNPERFNFAVKLSAIVAYAGVTGVDRNKIDKAYRVVYESNLFDMIYENVNHYQFESMVNAAKDKIKHIADGIINANSIKMDNLVSKMDDMMESSQRVLQEFSSEEFAEKLREATAVLGNIEPNNASGAESITLLD